MTVDCGYVIYISASNRVLFPNLINLAVAMVPRRVHPPTICTYQTYSPIGLKPSWLPRK